MEKLTIAQAIEQGYKHWGYKDVDEQNLNTLEGTTEDDFNGISVPVLAKKETSYLSVDGANLAERICDDIMDDPEVFFDYDDIFKTIKKGTDFEKFAASINESLQAHPFWYLTDIELIP